MRRCSICLASALSAVDGIKFYFRKHRLGENGHTTAFTRSCAGWAGHPTEMILGLKILYQRFNVRGKDSFSNFKRRSVFSFESDITILSTYQWLINWKKACNSPFCFPNFWPDKWDESFYRAGPSHFSTPSCRSTDPFSTSRRPVCFVSSRYSFHRCCAAYCSIWKLKHSMVFVQFFFYHFESLADMAEIKNVSHKCSIFDISFARLNFFKCNPSVSNCLLQMYHC